MVEETWSMKYFSDDRSCCTNFDDVFLWRQSVDNFDEASLLRQVADEVAVILPPRQAEVIRPVRARVWRWDVDEPPVWRVRNYALRHRIHVRSDLQNMTNP